MDLALDIYQTTRNFLERGGDVLLVISGVVFLMWTLILDRLIYLSSEHLADVYSSAGNAYANNSPL